jgi:hypothetical protein
MPKYLFLSILFPGIYLRMSNGVKNVKELHSTIEKMHAYYYNYYYKEPGERSQYSDWVRAGRQRGRSSSPRRAKNFLFSTLSRPALGPTQPPVQWVLGALFPGVKQPGREADQSPLNSAEVKKMWIYTSTPPYALMA